MKINKAQKHDQNASYIVKSLLGGLFNVFFFCLSYPDILQRSHQPALDSLFFLAGCVGSCSHRKVKSLIDEYSCDTFFPRCDCDDFLHQIVKSDEYLYSNDAFIQIFNNAISLVASISQDIMDCII